MPRGVLPWPGGMARGDWRPSWPPAAGRGTGAGVRTASSERNVHNDRLQPNASRRMPDLARHWAIERAPTLKMAMRRGRPAVRALAATICLAPGRGLKIPRLAAKSPSTKPVFLDFWGRAGFTIENGHVRGRTTMWTTTCRWKRSWSFRFMFGVTLAHCLSCRCARIKAWNGMRQHGTWQNSAHVS